MPTNLHAFASGGPLHAMTQYKQWLLFVRTEWNPVKQKWDKKPIQVNGWGMPWRSAPEKLMTFDEAVRALGQWPEAYLGFVLSEADPFFCLDIDKCRDGSGWSATALDLVNRLPSGVVEVSLSGDGLHVFGSCADLPHACDNDSLGAEFYTKHRAIALTGDVAESLNAISADSTLDVISLVSEFFPREERAVRRNGEGAKIDDLEKAREAIKFIDPNLNYNDWIGNCMAIHAAGVEADAEELAWQIAQEYTALSPKYVPGYLDHKWGSFRADGGLTLGTLFHHAKAGGYRTREEIDASEAFKAFREQHVPTPKTPLPPVLASENPDIIVEVEERETGIRYPSDYLPMFGAMVYVASLHSIWTPDGQILDQKRFDALYSGFQYALDQEARKCVDSPWEAFFKCRCYKFKRVRYACFRPDLQPGAIITHEGRTSVNTYYPVPVACMEGDVSPFLRHLEKILPDERDRTILLSYLAAVVQYPGRKFQWAPLLQGWEGNGKSFVCDVMEHAVGFTYTHKPQAEDLGNKFNSWMYGKLLIVVEDVYVPGHKANIIEALKPMITGKRVGLQGKGADQITAEVCCNFIFNSNFRNALGQAVKGRRYCVFFTAQQEPSDLVRDGMNGEYFKNLYDWAAGGGFAAVTHFLRNYAIADEFNPAGTCTVAPHTSTYAEVIEEAAGVVEQELLAAIAEGRPGFVDPWVSSQAVDKLLRETKLDTRVPRNKRRALIESLGYVRHPHLPDGRTNNAVLPDGARSTLFVKAGHPILELTGAAAIAERYSKTQQEAIKVLMPPVTAGDSPNAR